MNGYKPPSDKSVGVAFLLTFFFGPLGMLYTQVWAALLMLVIAFIVAFVTLGFGLIVVWIACIVWACVSASRQHSQYQAWLVQSHAAATSYATSLTQGGPTPGWYPDPQGLAPYRWWNGYEWTAHISGPSQLGRAGGPPLSPPTLPQQTSTDPEAPTG